MTFPYQELLSLKFDIVAIAATGAALVFWTVVPLTLIHPVLTLFRRFRRSDVKNYTWQ